MEHKRVLVTGAGGYVGGQLASRLVNQGYHVHLFDLPGVSYELISSDQVRPFFGNMLDPEDLKPALEGCDALFHVAGYAKQWSRDPSIFYHVNTGGPVTVLKAAQELGIRKCVVTSSIVSMGPTQPGELANESRARPHHRFYTDYEASKTLGEQSALALNRPDFSVVVVNPTRIYGPGKKTEGNALSRAFEWYLQGRFPFLLGGGKHLGNYVYISDLIEGHILALQKGQAGHRYILGGENASFYDLFRILDEVSRRKHLKIALPKTLALSISHLDEWIARVLRRYPNITPGWVRTYLEHWAFTPEKAQNELGYQYIPLKEGIHKTYEWIMGKTEVA